MKEFSNGLTTMLQQEITLLDGLTVNNLIAKDPSADLPEPSKFVKRRQLNCCTLLFDLSDVVQLNNSSHAAVLNINYLLLLGQKDISHCIRNKYI